jgi:hypothetical protein
MATSFPHSQLKTVISGATTVIRTCYADTKTSVLNAVRRRRRWQVPISLSTPRDEPERPGELHLKREAVSQLRPAPHDLGCRIRLTCGFSCWLTVDATQMYLNDSVKTFEFVLESELAGDAVRGLEHAWITATSILDGKCLSTSQP